MASSFKVPDIEEQPETAYDDTDMEDNDEQQPSTSNANEMANDIVKEAKNALANQEKTTSTKKASAKGKGAATAGKKSTSANPSHKRKSPPFINETTAVDTEEQDTSSDATGSMAGLGECRDFTILPFAKVADALFLP